jgi:polyisoprenoid-binding protein YceI
MPLSRTVVAFTLIAALASSAFAADAKFNLTGDNTKIEFVGTKKDGSHTGTFKKLAGAATVTGTDVATLKLSVVIDVESITTDNAKLTSHLKSPDFFEVKKFPEAKFVSTEIKKSADGFTVTGELTMHGQTKSVTFPSKISVEGAGLKLTAKFTIDRNEWGIVYGKGMVDANVALSLSIEAKK